MRNLKEYNDKYNHALDRIYDLFKHGREIEALLFRKLSMARDELMRIKACPGADAEIKQLCERGLRDSFFNEDI